jgi:hypothetical protein
MHLDVLILNSGEWLLSEQLPAEPWHVLIYRERGEPRNELHLWLPRETERRSGEYAFKRYWLEGDARWCIEIPPDPDRLRSIYVAASGVVRVRFTALDGLVLWADYRGSQRLADFTDHELQRLRLGARAGPYSRI